MWEAFSEVARSSNFGVVAVFLIIVVAIGIMMVKTGMLTIHTSAVNFGAADKERDIMRQQVEWCRMHFEAMEAMMAKPEVYDEWRGKYVAERVYDEYVEWIMLNHFNKSPAYIEIKQDKIVALVHKLTTLDYFHTKEFENFLRDDTKECIEKLIQIRTVYK